MKSNKHIELIILCIRADMSHNLDLGNEGDDIVFSHTWKHNTY